jgi:urease subunit beta
MTPGEILPAPGQVAVTPPVVATIEVSNHGDRPIQVGSHFHFAEVNPALIFDRDAAFGMRLGIPAGTSVRFEPGLSRSVVLVPLGGNRVVRGLRGLVGGPLDAHRHAPS